MFDFPASPTTGQVSNGYMFNGVGWIGGPGVAGPVTEQFFDVSGLYGKDIAVPTWAKGAEITASIIPVGSSVLGLRVSADGTTFPQGASDYSVSAPYHTSLPTAAYGTQANVARDYMTLSIAGTYVPLQHQIDAFITLERRLTTEVFSARSYARAYDTTSGSSTSWFYTWPQPGTLGTALRIAALRFLPTIGPFGNGSFIRVKWIGDSAAIPQSNAIADAPNDSFQYLRGQNAWNSGGTLSGDLTISKAAPTFTLNASSANNVVSRMTVGGKDRWAFFLGNPESSGNAGSDLFIGGYNDAGGYISTNMIITRATGVVTATGLPPTPKNGVGIGQATSQTFAINTAATLPAGGSWWWFSYGLSSTGTVTTALWAGVGAGGTAVLGATASVAWQLCMWRIA